MLQQSNTLINYQVTGAWLEHHDPGERKFIDIGDLVLESKSVLPNVKIAYQTWGQLSPTKDNAILVNHALTGWSDVPAWWPDLIGPGLTFDTNKYFVVCPNVIGGCQGSTGPASLHPDGKRWGSRFPKLTVRDQVQAEYLFTKKLGIKKYQLAVGPSLGGMRSLEWAIQYPELVGAICTIGSSAIATGDQIAFATIQIRAIKQDSNFANGDYYENQIGPIEGMGIARRIAHLTYRTELEMDLRFGTQIQDDDSGRFAVASYLDHQAEKLAKRFDANTYIILSEAMNTHDVGRDRGGIVSALSSIKVPVHVIAMDTDRLFPQRLQEEIVESTPTAHPLHVINSPFGHDGFLIEVESVGSIIKNILK